MQTLKTTKPQLTSEVTALDSVISTGADCILDNW